IGHPLLQPVLEGFLRLQRQPLTTQACRYLEAAARAVADDETGAFAPIGALGMDSMDRPCPDLEAQQSLLVGVASSLGGGDIPWQVAARAFVSLAAVGPENATELLPTFLDHPNPFVRGYAARGATLLADRSVLRTLATDADSNVRTAALSGLFSLDGHAIDVLLVEALASDDPQLLLTVAGLLEGTPAPDVAADAALDAFLRISAAERETWRDPRRALLGLLATTGRAEQAPALEPYLADYDPLVARDVAALLTRWTGRQRTADPTPLPREPLPSARELRAMDGAIVRLHMEGGGTIDIGLRPYLATTNAYRFFRLAREGYFDGLTFHRWAPNFVLQGGSPAANEYQGAAAFSRDEVGLAPHWRGTVGISTRGHDTGDAQIFINLLDNVRLDHTYTVVGSVVAGMETVDRTMDGAVIERAEVIPGGDGA
ncbi:MAG: peptidylprolyl isomerase, partial [Longimicrobiales bacterium]|nr:peptidylprolyl isomerase [Longimicrobiales bacterium]